MDLSSLAERDEEPSFFLEGSVAASTIYGSVDEFQGENEASGTLDDDDDIFAVVSLADRDDDEDNSSFDLDVQKGNHSTVSSINASLLDDQPQLEQTTKETGHSQPSKDQPSIPSSWESLIETGLARLTEAEQEQAARYNQAYEQLARQHDQCVIESTPQVEHRNRLRHQLVRFLLDRKLQYTQGNLDLALERFRNFLLFRKEYQVNELRNKERQWENMQLRGHDGEGRANVLVSLAPTSQRTSRGCFEACINILEQAIAHSENSEISLSVDFRGATLYNMQLLCIFNDMLYLFQNHYLEHLWKVYLVDAPFWLRLLGTLLCYCLRLHMFEFLESLDHYRCLHNLEPLPPPTAMVVPSFQLPSSSESAFEQPELELLWKQSTDDDDASMVPQLVRSPATSSALLCRSILE